jgi:hypothetical protein
MMLRSIANRALSPLGMKLVPERHDQLFYLHRYEGGEAEYRDTQIRWNKAKFDQVWADEKTLQTIADDILAHGLASEGLCHGARNGWEVDWFAKALSCPVIGTDISDTANDVPNLVCHDFHEPRDDFTGRFGFIYTNSLDQALDPKKALLAWADQLAPDGRIYIEHTMQHGPAGASEMDPFGVHPVAFPYWLYDQGIGHMMERILHVEGVAHKAKGHVWIFVLKA